MNTFLRHLRHPIRFAALLLRAPLEKYCASKMPRRNKPAPKTGKVFKILAALEFKVRKISAAR